MRFIIGLVLFVSCYQISFAVAVPRPVEKPSFPRIVERILEQEILKKHPELAEKKAEIEAQLYADDRLRDPIKKWLQLAIISFGVGVLFVLAAAILQKAQGTASPDVNDSCLVVLLGCIGVMSLFFSIIAIVIWWVKLNAG